MTILSVISDFRTIETPRDNDGLTYPWDIIAYCRYLDMYPPKALETFKKIFPSCTEIKIEPPILLTSLDDHDPINDFAQNGITLLGVLNPTSNNEVLPEV